MCGFTHIIILTNTHTTHAISSIRLWADTMREAKWFSILADETTDLSNHEQLLISIRWVSDTYEVNEDFIGLVIRSVLCWCCEYDGLSPRFRYTNSD